jgi:hypothetical protein
MAVAKQLETSKEKVQRILKARAKKDNSLIIKIQESDLYDWDTTARLTLLVIAFGQRTNEDAYVPEDMPDVLKADILGWCDMAQWRIALRVGKSEVQIQRIIQRMEKQNVIEVRTWEDDNHASHNLYRIIEKTVNARQRPAQKPDVERGKRYKKPRGANKGSFSATNQPRKAANVNPEVAEMDEE